MGRMCCGKIFLALLFCCAGILNAAPKPAAKNGPPPPPDLPKAKPAPSVWPIKFDRETVLKELMENTRAGWDRRLGPDYAFYHPEGTNAADFPTLYEPPVKNGPGNRRYEYGGPWSEDCGDFSSTQGQILYVPDTVGTMPVDRVTILEMTNYTYSERPEPPWWGGFRPEPLSSAWTAAAGGAKLGLPVGMARGMINWANCGVIVFSRGLVGTAGTCTGNGTNPTLKLPAGKIPTAITVTTKNEFALVTLVDTNQALGQVAVLALESNGRGFAHDWKEAHWGIVNVAMFTGIKLLGLIDLPGMAYPSSISSAGSTTSVRLNGPDGHQSVLSKFDLSEQAIRDGFMKGGNANFVNRYGYAIVASKVEQKIAFIDLQPLFDKVRDMHFTTAEKYKKTQESGQDPKQWPYAFEVDPSWKPTVVRVIPHRGPIAVLASLHGSFKESRAYVASEDGTVGIYTVGALASEEPADPTHIRFVNSGKVGRNPICLTYQKGAKDQFIAVSRGDREVVWVSCEKDEFKIIKKLRDSRMIDPVFAEVADNHGTEAPIITVADFKGRKVINYRYGDIVYATNGGARFGMGPDGKDEFECGGTLDFPGTPFCVSATNVN